jgi:hypothetical protein
MLATVVANLHQLEKMMAQVEQLGRRHVTYGVTADHYAPVGEALLWTLEQGLGAEFTPSVKAAWTEAYLALSGAMKRAAAERLDRGRATTGVDTEANGDRLELERLPGRGSAVLEKAADLRRFSSVSKFRRMPGRLSRVSAMHKRLNAYIATLEEDLTPRDLLTSYLSGRATE